MASETHDGSLNYISDNGNEKKWMFVIYLGIINRNTC